MPRCAQL